MYAIPSDEEIIEAARKVLAACGRVESQEALARLIRKEMKREDPNRDVRVKAERARRLVLGAKVAELEIVYRELADKGTPRKCPSCGGRVRPLKNKTIFDGTVTLGFECVKCGYWAGLHRKIPAKYIFKRVV